MADPREYLYFYLIGRRDDEIACSIDLELLAERVFSGQPLREVTAEFAESAMKAAELDGFKRTWLRDYAAEIEEAGGDRERAYQFYRQGQVDELASSLEPEVLQQVQDTLDEGENVFERAANHDDPPEDEGDDAVDDDEGTSIQ